MSDPILPEKQSFWRRLSVGIGGASLVSIPLSMGVTIFDRSVIQVVNGSSPSLGVAVGGGFKTLFKAPIKTFLQHDNRALFIVYGSTYVTKYSVDAACDYKEIPSAWPVLGATTFINTTFGIVKDRYLAQMFGSGVPNFPNLSYGCFTLRDMIIVGVSFIIPPKVAPHIQEKFPTLSKDTCDVIAQIGCPGIAQIAATPIHIMGLDLYNRPDVKWGQRIKDVFRKSLDPLAVRMVRQMYVFGFGAVAIKKSTKYFGFFDPTETYASSR